MVGVPDMPPPEDRYWESFTARVLDRVEEDAVIRVPERRKPRRSWNLMIPRMVPAFSIALVVVVAAGVLMKIGDPMPVSKAPVIRLESVPEKGVPVVDMKTLPEESDGGKGEYYTDAPGEKSPRASVEKAREIEDSYRPTQTQTQTQAPARAPATGPEQIAVLKEVEEGTIVVRKREALAAPEVENETEGGDAEAAGVPEAEETLSPKAKAEKLLPSVPAVMDGGVVALGEVDSAAPEVQLKSKLDQTEVPPEISIAQPETPQVEERPSIAPMIQDADLDFAGGRDDQARESVVGPVAKPSDPSLTEGNERDNSIIVTHSASTGADPEEVSISVSDIQLRKLEEPKKQMDEVALLTPGEPSEENKIAKSGMETLGSSVPTEEAKQVLASRSPPYRGPEDQLIHARNLADVRKFWESEQVLKDLLSQRLSFPIQEEASILLVKVLSSQNRIGEAQQVLDDARVQFPASEMIQTFELKQEEGGE
jgi:hypothetical protein